MPCEINIKNARDFDFIKIKQYKIKTVFVLVFVLKNCK